MKVLSFVSHKGGVGKTTNAFHVASGLPFAIMDGFVHNQVLFIDLDESGDGTRYFLPEYTGRKDYIKEHGIKTLSDFLTCEPTKEALLACTQTIEGEGISFIASSAYSEFEPLLDADPLLLRKRLDLIGDCFNVCIIDSPPTRGWLQRVALLSADFVMLCSDISYGGLQGVQDALADITELNRTYRRAIEVPGILVQSLPPLTDKRENFRVFSQAKGSDWFSAELEKITEVKPIYLPYDRSLLLSVRYERQYIYSYSRKALAISYAALAVWLVENYIESQLQYPAYRPFEQSYSNFTKDEK